MYDRNFTIEALPERIPEAIEMITQTGSVVGLTSRMCFEMQVALAEALNNIVEHALPDNRKEKIFIDCQKNGNYFEINLCDRGNPISTNPDHRFPEHDEKGGRGWPIIFRWMDQVEYNHARGWNHLTLKKALPTIAGSGD
ncbi:MAG: ATP-binding protein [Gammaproteobacteria bacterium]|nr:ATP-binding protein [Gammaproteobacteria bacterium]